MDKSMWLWLFVGSIFGLLAVVFRGRIRWGWLPIVGLHIIVAVVLLYVAGLAEPYTHVHIPMNAATIATVSVLGVPGLAALAGLKLLLF